MNDKPVSKAVSRTSAEKCMINLTCSLADANTFVMKPFSAGFTFYHEAVKETKLGKAIKNSSIRHRRFKHTCTFAHFIRTQILLAGKSNTAYRNPTWSMANSGDPYQNINKYH